MLYTEDFSMRHYVGFSQIGSQISRSSIMVNHGTLSTVTHSSVNLSAFTMCIFIISIWYVYSYHYSFASI